MYKPSPTKAAKKAAQKVAAKRDEIHQKLESRKDNHLWDKAIFHGYRVLEAAANSVAKAVVEFAQHFETVAVLSLAGFGAAHLLGEIPFYILLPAWVEAPMVIGVVSVILILILLKSADFRSKRRIRASINY